MAWLFLDVRHLGCSPWFRTCGASGSEIAHFFDISVIGSGLHADYGEPIDVDNDIGLEDLLIAMIFPLGISAFICFILYRRMKTARQKTEADEYMPGFTLRVKRDRYTHTTRERTYDPPQKESNSSGGSSVDSDGFGGSSGGSF